MKHSTPPSPPQSVLFLCTANSCRSQMAEGFARGIAPPAIRVYSAGIAPAGVNPTAIRVMREVEVDITNQISKGISQLPLEAIDTVITLCDYANQYCPSFPLPVRRLHWPIKDPVGARGTEEAVQNAFRTPLDEIQAKIKMFFEDLRSD